MNNGPLVSIILPTYNGSRYIKQSIESCLDQTHKNIELIIVDDCSTDGTSSIIKSYVDKRIKYIHNELNLRLPRSLNRGFAQAKGDYLTWTSDDNFYTKEAIAEMLAFLKAKGCDFVYCDYYSFENSDVSRTELIRLPERASFERINPVRACFLYSSKVKKIVGDYDPDLELVEDYDYWIRVSRKFSLCHLAKPLYFYRVHDQSLYSKRYWEVETVKLLVRLKHDIADIIGTVRLFRELLFRRREKKPSVFEKILAKTIYSISIYFLLIGFKKGKIGFKEARTGLNDLINKK